MQFHCPAKKPVRSCTKAAYCHGQTSPPATVDITRVTVAMPASTNAMVQIKRESLKSSRRSSETHQPNASAADNGTKVSLASAPNTPQIGNKYQRPASNDHTMNIKKQHSAE